MIHTSANISVDDYSVYAYCKALIDRFFKILPMKECGEPSVTTYMYSLQCEMLGCQQFVTALRDDATFVSLLAILQYLIDNPDCAVHSVKREVFKAISLCERLCEKYSCEEAITE